MAVTAEELLIQIRADTSKVSAEMNKLHTMMARQLAAVAKETQKTNQMFATMAATIRGALAGALAGFSVAKLVQMGRESLIWADNLKTAADRIGISTTALQELQGAGATVKITADEMTKAMESFSVKFAEAASGKGDGAEALKQLGISARDSMGNVKGLERVLGEVADKLRQFDRPSQLAIAKSFFGEGDALKFVQLLGQGSARLNELRGAAARAGEVVDGELVAAGERFNQKIVELNRRIETDTRAAFLSLAPILDDLAGKVEKVANRADVLKRFGANAMGPMLLQEMFPNTADAFRRGVQGLFPKSLSGALGMVDPNADVTASADAEAFRRAAEAQNRAGLNFSPGTKVAKFGGESELEKKLRELREQYNITRIEFEQGPRAAAWEKTADDLRRLGLSVQQVGELKKRYFDGSDELKAATAARDYAAEAQVAAQAAALEATGQQAAADALRMKFEWSQKYGPQISAYYSDWIDKTAKWREEQNRAAEQMRTLHQGMTSAIENGAAAMADAFEAFFDKNRSGWQEMGQAAIGVLKAIAREMLMTMAIKPAANAGGEWLSKIIGIGVKAIGSAFGGSTIGSAAGASYAGPGAPTGYAEGGNPPVDRWSLVGENGPELIKPRAPMTVIPNHALGGMGGSVNLYGSDSASIEIGQLKGALRQLGVRVNQIDRSIEPRAMGAVADGSRRGGSFASAIGR